MGVLFGSWITISSLITDGTVDPFEVIFQFVFCGLIGSWVLVHYHIEMIKNLGFKELSQDVLSSKQERLISTQYSQTELMDAVLNDPVLGKLYLRKNDDEITLRTGVSFYSLGTTIHIESLGQREDKNEYKVESKPRYYIGQADGGKSLKYITQIEKVV